MAQTLNLVISIYGPLPKKPCALEAVQKEIEIMKSRRSWWQKLVEMI